MKKKDEVIKQLEEANELLMRYVTLQEPHGISRGEIIDYLGKYGLLEKADDENK